MDTETNSNPSEGTSVDQIADLLNDTPTKDEISEETLTDESTDVDESEEQIEETEEQEDGAEEEPADETLEESWESVLGLDEDQLNFDEEGNLVGVNVKIDGKQSTVSMKDLVAGYQTNKVFTQKSQALAEERKAFDQTRNQFEQAYTTKLENADTLVNILGNRLVGEYESVNWEQLRVENPAEYAALKQDYASRAQEIQQAQQALSQEKQMVANQRDIEQKHRMQNVIRYEMEQMISKNPSWVNNETRLKDMKEIKEQAIEAYGFTADQFDNVTDHRLVEVLKDAIAFRKGKKMVTEKIKRPVPKFQKSKGKAPSKKVTKLDKLTKRAKTVKGANKRTAQTDAIVELLSGVA